MLKAFQSKVVTTEEKLIRNRIKDLKLSTEQATNILISDLAIARFNFAILGINLSIYDEQVKILVYLNTKNVAVGEEDLVKFYLDYQSRTKNTSYPLDNFLNYLIQQNLILKNDLGYFITVLGREYLSFRVSSGAPL